MYLLINHTKPTLGISSHDAKLDLANHWLYLTDNEIKSIVMSGEKNFNLRYIMTASGLYGVQKIPDSSRISKSFCQIRRKLGDGMRLLFMSRIEGACDYRGKNGHRCLF